MANLYLNKENEAKLLELLEIKELNTVDVLDRIAELMHSVPVVGVAAEEIKQQPVAVYTEQQINTFKTLIEAYQAGRREFAVTYPDTGITKTVDLEGAVEFFNFYDLYDRYNNDEKFW